LKLRQLEVTRELKEIELKSSATASQSDFCDRHGNIVQGDELQEHMHRRISVLEEEKV